MRMVRSLPDTNLITPKKRLVEVEGNDYNTLQIYRNLLQKRGECCTRQRERIKVGHWDKYPCAKLVNRWDRLRLHFLFIIRSLYK